MSTLMATLKRMGRAAALVITLFSLVALAGVLGVSYLIFQYSRDLPDYHQLATYDPPVTTRFYAADGQLLTQYAKENRVYVPIEAIPKRLRNAFIAAEDQNFYHHPGIDVISILRAAVQNVVNLGRNRGLVGGSTITQQVVKNFLLTNERSLARKIKEAILSFRISQTFSKDRILELYLNEIYLGNRSYGVAAAALNYFNKSIDELTIEDAALLAALPKAPSSLDPYRNPERARARRDWVIERIREDGHISEIDAVLALSQPIKLAPSQNASGITADFFAETVRQRLNERFGEQKVLEGGLVVHTTLDPKLQEIAVQSLREGLMEYDRRHGWRGPVAKINLTGDGNWQEPLKQVIPPASLGKWDIAVVLGTNEKTARVGLRDGRVGIIPLSEMTWARKFISINGIGPQVSSPSDVVSKGDVLAVEALPGTDGLTFTLRQVPEINGAIVAMDPHTGKVLALQGGFYFGDSQFNRATQANRQPGSSFKPFVYLSALEHGFTPASIIVDEEIQLEQGKDLPEWKPQNYSGEYYGPTTLRVGLEKSRNAMTVRLVQLMGLKYVVEVTKRFGITDNPVYNYSLALGSTETTLLSLTNAYASIVNGGKKVHPILVDRVQNKQGALVYRSDDRPCGDCMIQAPDPALEGIPVQASRIPPVLLDERSSITDPITAYQMVSMLQGVIDRGTGRAAQSLNRTLAGKTGTTNDSVDTWFMGFSADLVTGVYVGFDNPSSLGRHETGASAALPIWIAFMKNALEGEPDIPFRRPSGVKLVRIDASTGLPPAPGTSAGQIIFEAFRSGTEPRAQEATPSSTGGIPSIGGSGIY